MRVLRTPEVLELTGLSRTTIWRFERNDGFPPRLRLGPNAVGWFEDDVVTWLHSRQRGLGPYQADESGIL